MRRGIAIAIMMLVGACQPPGATNGGGKATRTNAAPSTSPSTAPSAAGPRPKASPAPKASAGTGATATSSAAPITDVTKLGRLQAPPGATSKLTGTIKVDAAYMVSAGAGNILSHNGAQIVAAGGLNMIAAGAGNLVAAGGLNLVAAGGLNLVAAGGLNLVAAGGLNMIAAGAGNALPANAGAYALAQAATAPRAGDQLPAAGMLVSVASLTTRQYLPLGQDASGQPVYVVLSDASGGYELYVPEGADTNLLVIVQPPGKPDPRLVFNVFTPRAEETRRIVDEDSALGARYLRTCMIARLNETLINDDPAAMMAMFNGEAAAMEGISEILIRFAKYYRAIAISKGIGRDTDPRVRSAMSQAIADAALAMLDIEGVEMDPVLAPQWTGDRRARAAQVLGAAMRDLRERGARYLADPADPTRYRERIDPAFLAKVNGPQEREVGHFDVSTIPPLIEPNRRILLPADLTTFVIDEYLAPHRDWVWTPLSNLYTWIEPDPAASAAASREAGEQFSNTVRFSAAALAGTLAINLAPLGEGPDAQPGTPAGLAAVAAARAFDPAEERP